jgi:hypothetical protein
VGASLRHDGLHARELRRELPEEQVVEGDHGVRLAAPEVGLELHHRVASGPGEAPDRVHEQALQVLREVRPPEELHRILVLGGRFPQVHLPQVGGELRLLVAAARHVRVRAHHFPPRLQGTRRGSLHQRSAGLPALGPHLLVEPHPQ